MMKIFSRTIVACCAWVMTAASLPAAPDPIRIAPIIVVHPWLKPVTKTELPIVNSRDEIMRVRSVQAPDGLYVDSFPREVPPRAGAMIVIALKDRSMGLAGRTSQVRVLTDQGPLVYTIRQQQEPMFTLESDRLAWSAADASAPKQIRLHVAMPQLVPASVTLEPADAGAASLKPTGTEGDYLIEITPAVHAPRQFTASLTFKPPLPGAKARISCELLSH